MRSRAAFFISHPVRALTGLAAVMMAAGATVGTGANFTSQTANPSNTFSAGNLTTTNSKDGAAILTASGMKPGDSTNGTVVITNTGNVAGTLTLTKSNVSDTAGPNGGTLSTKLNVKVEDVTVPSSPTTIYDGVIGSMGSQSIGSLTAGVAKTYKFTVSFPDGGTPSSNTTGDNAYKGSSMSIQYNWTAAS